MRVKKIVSIAAAASIALNTLSCFPAFAEEKKEDDTLYTCVFALKEKHLAEYEEAQKSGVGSFIMTDEGKEAYDKIRDEQKRLMSDISELIGREPALKYAYTASCNAVCSMLTEDEYKKVRKNAKQLGITAEFADSDVRDDEPKAALKTEKSDKDDKTVITSRILEGIGVKGGDYKGEGTVIAIIDNEFLPDHEYFTMPAGVEGRIKKEDIEALSPYLTSMTYSDAKDPYVSEKVPFAFDYRQKDTKTDMLIEGDSSHGTHVAGIAAGNGTKIKKSNGYYPNGVAPEAQILMMQLETLTTCDSCAAIDDILFLGADVVNCSYGIWGWDCAGDDGQTVIERTAFNSLRSCGITVCAAAGNSGIACRDDMRTTSPLDAFITDTYTSSMPGGLTSTISVASADNYYVASGYFTCGKEKFDVAISDNVFKELNGKPTDFVVVRGKGTAADFDASPSVAGKIAVYDRGAYFAETAQNALDRGAVGVIICNTPGRELFGPYVECAMPICMVSASSGQKLKKLEGKKITFNDEQKVALAPNGETISSFSSWGPNSDLTFTVDIAGFGGNIYSSVSEKEKYAFESGTSMASPEMTGCVALIKQYLKENKEKYGITAEKDYPDVIQALLMSTATPISYNGANIAASPRVQGSGLANVASAIETPAYLYTRDKSALNMPKAAFGDDPDRKGRYEFSFFIRNISGEPVTYDLNSILMSSFLNPATNSIDMNDRILTGSEVQFLADGEKADSVTVAAGKSAEIKVKITVSEKEKAYMDDCFPNGCFVEGFVRLESREFPDLTLPLMGYYGGWLYENFIVEPIAGCGLDPVYEYSYCIDENGVRLGANFIENMLYGDASPFDFIAFSPNGDGYADDFVVQLVALRTADYFKTRIYNSKGELVFSDKKSPVFFSALVDSIHYPNSSEGAWDGKDNDGRTHNGEKYRLVVTVGKTYKGKTTEQEFTATLIIDNNAPKIVDYEIADGGKLGKYIIMTASDDTAVAGALVYLGTNPNEEPVNAVLAEDDGNGGSVLYIPVDNITGVVTVVLYDAAYNVTAIQINIQ